MHSRYSLRRSTLMLAGTGLLSVCAFGPVQAHAPKADSAVESGQSAGRKSGPPQKAKRRLKAVPVIIGSSALLTQISAHNGTGATDFTASLPKGSIVTTPGGLSGISPLPSGLQVAPAAGPSSVTAVPEISSWATFVAIGAGSLGLVLRARKRAKAGG